MIEAMLPRATQIEVLREKASHRATMAAVASLFQKDGAKEYTAAMEGVLKQVELETKPKAAPNEAKRAAGKALIEGFAKLGIVARKHRGKK